MKKIFLLLLLTQCSIFAQSTLTKSIWRATIIRAGHELPFGLDITPKANGKYSVLALNGEERLPLDDGYFANDSLHIPMLIFDADLVVKVKDNQMTGWWKKNRNGQWYNALPFRAAIEPLYLFAKKPTPSKHNITGQYQAFFQKPNGDSTRAIAVFEQNGSKLKGTFMTATGDYRYLAGDVVGDSLMLSCYDGSHVYLFRAAILANGLLQGGLWSGVAGYQPWRATKSNAPTLPDPKTMTFLKDGYETLDFKFTDTKGKLVSLKDERFKNKVVVVQILGTWCPNCMDETRFLAPWYKKNASRGVEIIGLSFERINDLKISGPKIDFMTKRFGVTYPVLLAGTSDETAAQSLPMLNRIAGYPTTIYIDKKGKVRQIHTGFSGPGTGKYYDEYIEEFNRMITKLVNE